MNTLTRILRLIAVIALPLLLIVVGAAAIVSHAQDAPSSTPKVAPAAWSAPDVSAAQVPSLDKGPPATFRMPGPSPSHVPAVEPNQSPTLQSTACLGVTEIPTTECESLVTLYESTDGPNWINSTDWLSTTTPCSWFGVSCVADHVYLLDLDNNQLSGTIPTDLQFLPNLQAVFMNGNQLEGIIPAALGNLSALQYLNLSDNQLGGPIPASLGNVTVTIEIRLGNNNLSGSIPPELGNIISLWRLELWGNDLIGTIPSTLGALTRLRTLDLSSNHLEGGIPPVLGSLPLLRALHLSANNLSGSIPPELGDLAALQSLRLEGNQLDGPIPSTLGSLTTLTSLYLSENMLTGPIPPQLGSLATLQLLFMDRNRLTGTIPSEIGALTGLRSLTLDRNALEGEIPASVTNLTDVGLTPYELDLAYNKLTSTNASVMAFLGTRDPNWADTQTVPPTGLHVVDVYTGTVQLAWMPITYTLHGGYYEVSYASNPAGPYTVHGNTVNKLASAYTADGLPGGLTLHFRMRTYTPAHGDQQNDLWSGYTGVVTATTPEVGYWIYLPTVLRNYP